MSLFEPLKAELMRERPWLFEDLGFRATAEDYDQKCFGNSWVYLLSSSYPSVAIQFVRDRGEIYLQVHPRTEPRIYWDLDAICSELSGTLIRIPLELHPMAEHLRTSIAMLNEHLSRTKYPATKRLMEKRAIRIRLEVLAEYRSTPPTDETTQG